MERQGLVNSETGGWRHQLALACLSAGALLLESALTRLLAVAQSYHFSFLAISLALLGFGASGSLLSVWRGWRAQPEEKMVRQLVRRPERLLCAAAAGFAASVGLVYLAVNRIPFDSYRIAWESRQVGYFGLYFLALTLPFLLAGSGIGAALARSAGRSHLVYAANLFGSAAGVLVAPGALALAGVPGAVIVSALLGLMASLLTFARPKSRALACLRLALGLAAGLGLASFGWLAWLNAQAQAPLGLTLTPYKGLAQALRYPGASQVYQKWSASARVDLLANAGTHLLPGLSYTYPGAPPLQIGLALDGDALQPVTLQAPAEFAAIAAYLPEAPAFALRRGGRALVLEPGGGLGVLQALAGGATSVTAVFSDPLTLKALRAAQPDLLAEQGVQVVVEAPRAFLRQDHVRYAVVFLPLTDGYRPVTSGAYSLAETYSLTVEACQALLERLEPRGLLVVTRWLQLPPSEDVRLVATLVEALEARGQPPAGSLVVYRGIQTLTVLVQPGGWSPAELAQVRAFAAQRRYDLVWAPDIQAEETNRYNRLPESVYYAAVRELLQSSHRQAFYTGYPFAIQPARDDKPFFFHFFTWRQTPQLLASLGRSWQPFGGSGYLLLLALLGLVLLASAGLILLPLAWLKRQENLPASTQRSPARLAGRSFAYFGLIGLGFLFIEIPLIQGWILLLGQPIYAFSAVVLTLLFFSGIGSALARAAWLPRRATLALLVLLAALTPALRSWLVPLALGWSLLGRLGFVFLSLAPLATLMGLPFPLGLAWLETRAPRLVPWAWAVNGCASVLAAVLANLVALSYGFSAVLLLGAAAYAGAFGLVGHQWDETHVTQVGGA
jgi:hypothetical protein